MITQPTVNPAVAALSDDDLSLLSRYDQEQLGDLYRQLAIVHAQIKPLQAELRDVAWEADFRMGMELEYGFEPQVPGQPEPEAV